MAAQFWYFLLYSFLGFCLEVLFARVTHCPKRDRKCFCILPLCPVYGLGALLILALPPAVRERPLLLFLWAALSATAAEYGMSLLYEKLAGVAFWDYHHLPLHLHGRVCLPFSALWGLLGSILVRLVHPWAEHLAVRLPAALLFLWVPALTLDAVLTLLLLRREGSTDALRWYRRLPTARARNA